MKAARSLDGMNMTQGHKIYEIIRKFTKQAHEVMLASI
jgi:hypothetical protein